jgi:hypothetical protein
MSKLVPGILIGVAAMAGIYAAAATTASRVAATFVMTETASRARNVDFAIAAKRIVADRKVTRAKCALLADKLERACNAEAGARERRGAKAAFQP